jgi:hypothetical protein
MNAKRIGLGLAILLLFILIGGGTWWWWTHPAPLTAASYLPGNTVLYVSVPDASATRKAYELSHLKKVIASPELGSLWTVLWGEVSRQARPEDKQNIDKAAKVWELFDRNLTGEIFLAVTAVDFEQPDKVGFVAGLRPKQGLGDIAPLIEQLKKDAAEALKDAKNGKSTHEGVEYEWWDIDGKIKVCLAAVGPWEVLAVNETALFDFIDRLHSKGKTPGALADATAYKSVLARMKGRQDIITYIGIDSFQDKLVKLLESKGGNKNSAAGLKKIYSQFTGFGWGVRFEDGRIRESIVTLMPKATRPDLGKFYEPCAFKNLDMAGPQTYLYVGQSIDVPKYWNYVRDLYKDTTPQAAEAMNQVTEYAKAQGLDFDKNVLNALGNEFALLIDWPDDALFPDVALVIDVARPDDLKPTIAAILKNLDPLVASGMVPMTLSDSKAGSYDLKVVRTKQAPMISPSLIVSGDKFGIFLTESGAKRLLEHKNGSPLAKEALFTSLGGDDLKGVESLAYVNLGGLIDRTYLATKPFVGMAAAFSPDLQKILGDSKLPNKLSFTGDLGGSLLRTRVDDKGSTAICISNAGNLPIVAAVASGATIAALQKLGQNVSGAQAGQLSRNRQTASGQPTAESIHDELVELRAVIEAYALNNDVSKGTAVTWSAISSYLVPGSPLQKNGGKDPLGNPYVLGVVGETPADVAPETKAKFPDRDDSFWKPAAATTSGTTAPAAATAPATTTPDSATQPGS